MNVDSERYQRNKDHFVDKSLRASRMVRIDEAIALRKGLLELEAALGVLHSSHHFGWQVLVLIHNKRTIRK